MDRETLFFSYAREDSEFALKLAKDLRATGTNVWMDQLDIDAGEHWDLAIQNALKTCVGVLLILSPDSASSQNVMDEVSYALDEGKQVFPVLHRACDIPFRLRRLQYVDLTSDYETGFAKLQQALAGDQRPETSPSPSRSPAPAPQSRRWLIPVIGAGVLVAVVLIAMAALPTKVRVPSVLGMTLDEAHNAIVAAGLTVDVPPQVAGGGPVTRMSPASGVKVNKGSPVTLFISVPKLAGTSVADAKQLLMQVGLRVGEQRNDLSADITKDHVLRSEPVANAEVMWGASVDLVVSMGLPTASEMGLRSRRRPLQPGISISSQRGGTGTLCCILIDTQGTRYLFSADHVFSGDPGTLILQPGSGDGGKQADQVGVVARSLTPQPGQESRVTGVLARLNPNVDVSLDVVGLGPITGTTSDVQVGDTLRLVGRGSGIIELMVRRLDVETSVRLVGGTVRLVGLIETSLNRRGEGGDSGAPVLTKDGKLVGIMYAGSQTVSLVMPIEPILNALGVKLNQ